MIRTAFLILLSLCVASASGAEQEATAAGSTSAKVIGTITNISGNNVTVKSDSGAETAVTVQGTTRIVKTAPGQKDLKDATAIKLQDLQVGDRALVRGKPGDGSNSMTAGSVIVMKQGDVANRQQQDIQDWQRRGTGGIVRSVDAASGAITVATNSNQTATIETTPNTQFLRYAADSVKFNDAKKSSISEIKPGDQLRARGTHAAEGQQINADAVISGSFRNIAGTVSSVDAVAGTATVMDLITKRPAVVKITPETQMRKIPPEMAQHIAMFLRRPAGAASAGQPGAGQTPRAGGFPGSSGSGGPDFQQIIRRMPAATINDLQKGEAVMIVTTNGASGEQVTALTLLSGVEPILTAAPTQTSAANLLSGWSMGGGGEGENQ